MGLWTPDGIKISKVGQFGLLSIAKVCIRGIDKSIGHLQPRIFAYADDIVVFARSIRECTALLEEIFTCLARDEYIISWKKCRLYKAELEILR